MMKSKIIETQKRLKEYDEKLNFILHDITKEMAKEDPFIMDLFLQNSWVDDSYLLRLYCLRLHKNEFSNLHIWMKEQWGEDYHQNEECRNDYHRNEERGEDYHQNEECRNDYHRNEEIRSFLLEMNSMTDKFLKDLREKI